MKPTPAQRSVLDRLVQGYHLAQSWGGRASGPPVCWFSDYYDSTAYERLGKRYGDKYVHMGTFEALCKQGWIKQTDFRSGISTYEITDAGREALL